MDHSKLKSLYEAVRFVQESLADKCPEGQYFCNDEQKCKKIPSGHKVMADGELIKEWTLDDDFDTVMESLTSAVEVRNRSTEDLMGLYNWLIKGEGQRMYKDQNDNDWKKAAKIVATEMQNRAKKGDEFAKLAIQSSGPGTPNLNKIPTLKAVQHRIKQKPSAIKTLIKKILRSK